MAILLYLRLCLAPYVQPDRRLRKAEGFAEEVFKITFIRKMHKVGIVDEQHERGRVGRRLSAVIYPKPSAFIGRRLGNGYSRGYYVVQRACGYAHTVLVIVIFCLFLLSENRYNKGA